MTVQLYVLLATNIGLIGRVSAFKLCISKFSGSKRAKYGPQFTFIYNFPEIDNFTKKKKSTVKLLPRKTIIELMSFQENYLFH